MVFATTSSTDSSAASPVLPARGRRLAVQSVFLPEVLHLICKEVKKKKGMKPQIVSVEEGQVAADHTPNWTEFE